MTVFENFKTKNVDEMAEWIDKYCEFDNAPWWKYWDENYCNKCIEEKEKFSWCELNNNCKFFMNMDEIPSTKEMIKMWLESERQ